MKKNNYQNKCPSQYFERRFYWRLRLVRCVFLSLFLIPFDSGANEGIYEYPIEPSSRIQRSIDSSHRLVTNSVDATAAWIDRWLGGDDIDYSSKESQARLRHTGLWEERESYKDSLDFKLKFVLPKTEERLKLFISSDTDEIAVRDPVDSQAEQESEESSVALQISGFQKQYTETDYRIGLKSGSKLRASVRTKYLYPFSDVLQLRGLNEIYWQDQFGYGDRLRTDLDYLIGEQQLLRWRNVLDFNEVDRGVPWETSLVWSSAIDNDKIFSAYMRAFGQTRPSYWTEAYGPGIRYRQSVARSWFFVELETRVFWKENTLDEDRNSVAAFILRLELVFDESASDG